MASTPSALATLIARPVTTALPFSAQGGATQAADKASIRSNATQRMSLYDKFTGPPLVTGSALLKGGGGGGGGSVLPPSTYRANEEKTLSQAALYQAQADMQRAIIQGGVFRYQEALKQVDPAGSQAFQSEVQRMAGNYIQSSPAVAKTFGSTSGTQPSNTNTSYQPTKNATGATQGAQ
jgi:hypothetical protein